MTEENESGKLVPYEGVRQDSFEWYAQQLNKMTDLAMCEEYIKTSARAFVLAGQAFRKIRDNRLYERDWKGTNFETYCNQKWHLTRQQVNNIIRASTAILICIKHRGDDFAPQFSQTVWGMLARFLLNEKELVETAGELAARYGEGASKADAMEIIKEREERKQDESEIARLRELAADKEIERERKERAKSIKEYEDLHKQDEEMKGIEMEWQHMNKDDLSQQIPEADVQAFKAAFEQHWLTLLRQFGHTYPGHLLIELALKSLVAKHEELEAKMREWDKRTE